MGMGFVLAVASLAEGEVGALLAVVVVTASRNRMVALITAEPHVVSFISHLHIHVVVHFILKRLSQFLLVGLISSLRFGFLFTLFVTGADFYLVLE